MSFEERAKVFVNTFKDFNRDQQNEVLKRILLACQPLQLRLLYNGLKPLLAVDFVASLPKELVERIFSYLSVKSLCRVAQCNKLWRERSNHNAFWYRFCIQKGWDRFGEDLLQMPHTLISQKSNASLTNNTCTGLKPATCRWKEIYTRALSLDKNWEQGRYSVAPLLRGHKDPITCMTCDGSTIVSGSSDNTVRVWDVRTAKCGLVLDSPHTDSVRCVQLKDSLCASGCADGVIRLFDLKSGRCLRSFQGHTGAVEHLSFVGSTIISASADLTVRVWNSDTGALLRTMTGHSDEIQYCLQFTDDIIASGSADSTVRLWSHQGILLHTLEEHIGVVRCLCLSGNRLISGGDRKRIALWDVKEGKLLNVLHRNPTLLHLMWADETKLITASPDTPGTITIINYW
ncbi:F-box/WD repeat-containing protein 7 [Stylophora pistillata]|uniref:F-box/WD repeat-containing protein 7 n=1 Tax=Stylophora pistillata TaxID=50429 RepID=A0A2B4SH86_STYPI|nr:F-box/WD repeat-containing protein 7 [Stylophora pistillata]